MASYVHVPLSRSLRTRQVPGLQLSGGGKNVLRVQGAQKSPLVSPGLPDSPHRLRRISRGSCAGRRCRRGMRPQWKLQAPSASASAAPSPSPASPSTRNPGSPSPSALESLSRVLQSPPEASALTFLEGNTWLAEVGGVRFLVDPILEGPVDFGLPALACIRKLQLDNLGAAALADRVDVVLLTQGLDDHCHGRTMRAFARLCPAIPIIAAPGARGLLSSLCFSNVSYLSAGQSLSVGPILGPEHASSSQWEVSVRATAGALLAPWLPCENGYLLSCARQEQGQGQVRGEPSFSLYIEPHCMFRPEELQELQADVVVSHTFRVLLPPGVPILEGMQSALDLARLLRCKTFVPYRNEDADAGGVLPKLIRVEGSPAAFTELLKEKAPSVELVVPEPAQRIVFHNPK